MLNLHIQRRQITIYPSRGNTVYKQTAITAQNKSFPDVFQEKSVRQSVMKHDRNYVDTEENASSWYVSMFPCYLEKHAASL